MGTDRGAAYEKTKVRLLRRLSKTPQKLEPAAKKDSVLLFDKDGVPAAFPLAAVEDLIRSGLACNATQGLLDLTETGRAHVIRMESTGEPFADQHRVLEPKTVITPAGAETVVINAAESPLAQLARRKDKNGQPFLSPDQIEAGERLRRDYTRGHIISGTGMDLETRVGSGNTGARRNTQADLTDAAIAARQRVDAALASVGPELAGVLVDVCCYLKKLTSIEIERQWPARSAKIILRTALAVLARHYDPGSADAGKRPRTHRWGTADYRPQIKGR